MTHRRSLNFNAYFAAGRGAKQLAYQPGTLDAANLIAGRPYYGGIIDIFYFARLTTPKNIQLLLELTGGEFPLTDLIAIPDGITKRNLREAIPQARSAVPIKMSSDARLHIECLDTFGAGEWISLQGVADEIGEDLATL